MTIEDFEPKYAEQILDIYTHYVLDTAITFEYEIPKPETFLNRCLKFKNDYAFKVAIENELVIGYSYACRFRERKAYDFIAETSIYIAKDKQGNGIGSVLYKSLFDVLKELGIKQLVGVLTLPNDASELFHTKQGFKKQGEILKAGFKQNKWWDIGLYQKELC